ncbi:MAG: GTPase Era [Bdellovibrionaceae bacterium]|nr:GTPase Era [Pseudobdellovibrionaceae bacterium]
MSPVNEEKFKSGFVGVIGQPNAGKSTLVNALIGEKVGIVTAKPQTTRQKVLGVHTSKSSQCIFMDAPGVINSESGINSFLQKEYKSVIEDSDVLIAVLNIDENKPQKLETIIKLVSNSGKPWMAVISKVDLGLVHRVDQLKLLLSPFNVPVVLSRVHENVAKDRLESVRMQIFSNLENILPEGSMLYDSELYTTHTVREMSAEIIREQCFKLLHQELPYDLAVRVIKFEDQNPTMDKVYAEIVIDKPSQKSIVVGSGGKVIKRIGTQSRVEIEALTGKKLFLDLHVSVEPQWVKNQKKMKEFGYEIN